MSKPIQIHINLDNIGSEIVVQAQAIGAIINALRNHDPALGKSIGLHLHTAAAQIDKEPVTGRLLDLADVAEADLANDSEEIV